MVIRFYEDWQRQRAREFTNHLFSGMLNNIEPYEQPSQLLLTIPPIFLSN